MSSRLKLAQSAPPGTIVFFISGFTSHVYSTLGLARRLRELGHHVEYWGDRAIQRQILTQGFPWYEVGPTWYCYERILQRGWKSALRDPRGTWQRLREARARREGLRQSISDVEASLRRALARCVPDLVLVDPMIATYVPLLRSCGVRCVLLQDKPWPGFDPIVPPPTSSYIPRAARVTRYAVPFLWAAERLRLMLRRLGNAAIGAAGLYSYPQLAGAVLKHLGKDNSAAHAKVNRRVSYDFYIEGIEEWILGAPEQDLPRSRALPSTVRYIGAWPDLDRRQLTICLPKLEERSYLIYVAMGVSMPSWDADIALLRRIIEGLQSIPRAKLLVSAGDIRACNALRRLTKHAQISPFLPQLACLTQAHLAVTHGGANTYRECIVTNTPMLVLPRDYDQHGNAARVESLGLGLRGSRRRDTAESITRKALRILEDEGFRHRVGALNERLRASEPDLLASALCTIAGDAKTATY
jgi:UDP:flavonoid glycosyltransferase YjiC (YdhE family)